MNKWIQYTGKASLDNDLSVHFSWTTITLSKGSLESLGAAPKSFVTLHLDPEARLLGIKLSDKDTPGALKIQQTGSVSLAGFLKRFRLPMLEIGAMKGRMDGNMLVVPLPDAKKKKAEVTTVIDEPGRWG